MAYHVRTLLLELLSHHLLYSDVGQALAKIHRALRKYAGVHLVAGRVDVASSRTNTISNVLKLVQVGLVFKRHAAEANSNSDGCLAICLRTVTLAGVHGQCARNSCSHSHACTAAGGGIVVVGQAGNHRDASIVMTRADNFANTSSQRIRAKLQAEQST